jgi:hypothetical protein
VLIIKTKHNAKLRETEKNSFEVNQNVARIQLKKKNGSTVDTKIDAEELQRVLDAGTWFAEWHKDYNSYLAQHYSEDENHKGKQSLQTFILGVSPKTPIRHLNGDTLDNRKANLELYNRNSYNDYKELDAETAAIILRDSKGIESGRAIIDKSDLYRVLNNGYAWVYYKKEEQPYAVANTPTGRLYLDRFIMDAPKEGTVHHVNLNTLDNRKSNLEYIKKKEDASIDTTMDSQVSRDNI